MCSGGYFHVQSLSMVDILMCIGGYVHVQSWSTVDMFICRAGQWWIYLCAVVVNGGYVNVQW